MKSLNLTNLVLRCFVNKVFQDLKVEDIDRRRPLDCKTVSSSRSMHFVRFVDNSNNILLLGQDFTCTCDPCDYCVSRDYSNVDHTQSWRLITLEPTSISDAVEDVSEETLQWDDAIDNNDLAFELQVGDNFAVQMKDGNAKGVEFYILRCTRRMYINEKDDFTTNDFGQRIERNNELVEAQYFKQSCRSHLSYVLDNTGAKAFVLSHLFCMSKFPMIHARHRQKGHIVIYMLPENNYSTIEDVLQYQDHSHTKDSDSDVDSDVE